MRTRIMTMMKRRNEDDDNEKGGGDGDGVGNLMYWIRRRTKLLHV